MENAMILILCCFSEHREVRSVNEAINQEDNWPSEALRLETEENK